MLPTASYDKKEAERIWNDTSIITIFTTNYPLALSLLQVYSIRNKQEL